MDTCQYKYVRSYIVYMHTCTDTKQAIVHKYIQTCRPIHKADVQRRWTYIRAIGHINSACAVTRFLPRGRELIKILAPPDHLFSACPVCGLSAWFFHTGLSFFFMQISRTPQNVSTNAPPNSSRQTLPTPPTLVAQAKRHYFWLIGLLRCAATSALSSCSCSCIARLPVGAED